MQNWDKYSEEIRQFIEKYGTEEFQKLINAVKQYMPIFVQNKDLIPIALALIGTLVPIAVGSTVYAVNTLSKIGIFGVNVGSKAVKTTCEVAKTTVQVATDLLIKKPIYILSYPFRKEQKSKQILQMIQHCHLQQQQIKKYKKAYGSIIKQQSDKLFIIIREMGQSKDIRVMVGSLQRNDRVQRLLPIIRKNIGEFQKESIQLICYGNVLRLDTKLSTLKRNEFGAIQIHFIMMQTFG